MSPVWGRPAFGEFVEMLAGRSIDIRYRCARCNAKPSVRASCASAAEFGAG